MRHFLLALGAASLAIPVSMSVPTAKAEARKHRYEPRVYQGRDGRTYCRHSNGTTGLLVGGAGGALVGNQIAGRGDKLLGTVVGGVVGAVGGRAIDRRSTANSRCR